MKTPPAKRLVNKALPSNQSPGQEIGLAADQWIDRVCKFPVSSITRSVLNRSLGQMVEQTIDQTPDLTYQSLGQALGRTFDQIRNKLIVLVRLSNLISDQAVDSSRIPTGQELGQKIDQAIEQRRKRGQSTNQAIGHIIGQVITGIFGVKHAQAAS